MTPHGPGIWRRLAATLWGRGTAVGRPATAADEPPDERLAAQAGRLASLQLDLEERDGRIAQMKSEYAQLQRALGAAAEEAGHDHLERLFQKLAAPLANLTALAELAERGEVVEVGDLAQLVRSLGRELGRAGLEPIGPTGAEVTFDAALHQRMSGGAVTAGTPVKVQLPGFRMGTKVILKAMVSGAAEEGAEHG